MIYQNILEAIGHTPIVRRAKKHGPGKTVVSVLPDTAERYFSTPLFEE